MTLEEVFDIVKTKRSLVVLDGPRFRRAGGGAGGLCVGGKTLALDNLSSSRKAVNLVRRAAAALVIGGTTTFLFRSRASRAGRTGTTWRRQGRLLPRMAGRPRTREWPDIAYIVVKPRWMRYRELRRRARHRGIHPVSVGLREAPVRPLPRRRGVYTLSLQLTPIGIGE